MHETVSSSLHPWERLQHRFSHLSLVLETTSGMNKEHFFNAFINCENKLEEIIIIQERTTQLDTKLLMKSSTYSHVNTRPPVLPCKCHSLHSQGDLAAWDPPSVFGVPTEGFYGLKLLWFGRKKKKKERCVVLYIKKGGRRGRKVFCIDTRVFILFS